MSTRIDYRLAAKEYAKRLIQPLNVPPVDHPYIEAVLEEVAYFEHPIPELQVHLGRVGQYTLTIRGYVKHLDDVLWVNTFMGKDRGELLSKVQELKTHLTEKGAIKVIIMEKTQFHAAAEANSSVFAMPSGGGGGGGAASMGKKRRIVKRTE